MMGALIRKDLSLLRLYLRSLVGEIVAVLGLPSSAATSRTSPARKEDHLHS